ncbi:kinase-like domain-containing protein [Radiomyces spectabilis]|uniref:kinase-like domain-containing protein n=1 Tax=Radiomyces spectabilis TaxID=64574 RepID=UPI0022200C42|nr:kinase-like domain-containing protein [Radiomyces spectabilis]KAI8381069.1 kinase-like domain-containing protein [Radiomyces spectabilis]
MSDRSGVSTSQPALMHGPNDGLWSAATSSSQSVLSHDEGHQLEIAVIESTMMVYEFDKKKNRKRRRALSVFNVIVEDKRQNLSLVRYVFDFIEFDQRIKAHYRRCKLSLPQLTQPDLLMKRKGFRSFLLSFSNKYQKSNSEKIEIYLRRCALDPVIGRSSLLRDFLSAQRDEDRVASKQLIQSYVHRQLIENERNQMMCDFTLSPPSSRTPSVISMQSIQPQHSNFTSSVYRGRRSSSISLSSISSNHSVLSIAMSDSHVYRHRRASELEDPMPDSSHQHHDGKISIQDFQFIKVLGKGCMGKVLLVRHLQTSQLLALKAISKEWVITQREIEHTRMERDILATIAKIRHPFLVKLHHSFQDANQLFLVLDYHVGGDMATQLAKFYRFPPERCRFYTAEILLGMQELHRLGVLYRDLKPENILLAADGHIVLTDFGLSKMFPSGNVDDQRTRTFCGTAEYLAPEILRSEDYSYAVDFWSLGTILFEMLTGVTPFWAETHAEMYRRVLEDVLEFPEDFDPVTADFISGLLQRDPDHRLGTGVDGPIMIRSHPYFDTLDWADVYYKRVRPPYVPDLRSSTDFSNFDADFLQMTPRLSPVDDNVLSQSLEQAFQGYSYTGSLYMDKDHDHLYYHDSDEGYDFYTESDIQPSEYYASQYDETTATHHYGTSEDPTLSSLGDRRPRMSSYSLHSPDHDTY